MDTLKVIEDVLNKKVRPELNGHGGYIESISYEDGVYCYYLTGQCCTCPSSNIHIEILLKKELEQVVPELKQMVRQTLRPETVEQAMQILAASEEKYKKGLFDT